MMRSTREDGPRKVATSDIIEELIQLVREAAREGAAMALAAHVAPAIEAPSALLTKVGLATHLGVSPATIDRYVRAGVVPCITLGPDGPRRFHLPDVLAALAARESDALPMARPTKQTEPLAGVRLLGRGGPR